MLNWRYPSNKKLLQTYVPEVLLHGNPSSVDWVHEDPNHMIVAFENASCGIYDVETGQQVVQLDTTLSQVSWNTFAFIVQINQKTKLIITSMSRTALQLAQFPAS